METTRLSTRGQIVLPKNIRISLGLGSGHRVHLQRSMYELNGTISSGYCDSASE